MGLPTGCEPTISSQPAPESWPSQGLRPQDGHERNKRGRLGLGAQLYRARGGWIKLEFSLGRGDTPRACASNCRPRMASLMASTPRQNPSDGIFLGWDES